MPTLYHHPMSAASRFVRLVLSEYDLEADLVEERPWEQRPDFLALNPAATLPVYVDDSLQAVCGATVISEFIDEVFGVFKRDRRLLPDEPFRRAEVRRLTEWFLVKMEQDVTRYLVRERVFKLLMPKENGGGAPDSKALRAARANIHQHMRYLDWLTASRDWLAGNTMSYADFAAAGALSALDYLGEIKWGETANAKEWYQRMKSRPCMRPLLADRVSRIAPVSQYADLDF
ncbi:glutathione S-transferase family protein [Nitratireductor sp. XY-223]|uniref:glutathione S-transferase family protein n=1 Tax=Nitratireductor sp. XY-223 TaxID=2561926 RepID=UPI0010AA7E7B|nr:glutathione S-transferase family protein [Nitratireductor sp. XY-223]